MVPTKDSVGIGGKGSDATGVVDCDESMSCTTGVAVTERFGGSSADALVALLRTGARAASTV